MTPITHPGVARLLAWALVALGAGHIAYGIVTFRAPLADAVAAGVVGQFRQPVVRRLAFWFLVFGALPMLAGHAAVHAVGAGDAALLRLTSTYVLVTAAVGVMALPKSPFWVALVLAALLLAAGYGW